MIISSSAKFHKSPFVNEEELEHVVENNYEYLFGPGSMYLPKAKIKTADGIGTIPDGFAIDIENRKWYLVEAELAIHSVWTHIAPQVTKQILASLQSTAKEKIVDLAVAMHKGSDEIKDKFAENKIDIIDIRKVLNEIVKKDPIIGIPIDKISNDLKDWSQTQKFEVKLWVVSKYAEFANPKNVMYEFPEEFQPSFDTAIEDIKTSDTEIVRGRMVGDINIGTLIGLDLIKPGDVLSMEYSQRGGKKKKYSAKILEDGSLSVFDGIYSSPSLAALACIQDNGSSRTTVNGWTAWETDSGQLLSKLREVAKLKINKKETE